MVIFEFSQLLKSGEFEIAPKNLLLVYPKTSPIYFESRSLNPKLTLPFKGEIL